MSNKVFQQNLDDKKGPQPGGPYDSLTDFPSINDGQIRCQAGPSVQKTACGKLYRNDSARDNDTSVQSQPPPKWGSSNEGGRQRSCRG